MTNTKAKYTGTQEFLNRLGLTIGNIDRNFNLNDELHEVVHEALELEKYGCWYGEDQDGESPNGYNEYMAAFAEGWQDGRHNSSDPGLQCNLAMCRCSAGAPDQAVLKHISRTASGRKRPLAALPEGFSTAPDFNPRMFARCNRCSAPLEIRMDRLESAPEIQGIRSTCTNVHCPERSRNR